ncbi:ArsR family transcriptional regulator [Thalassotalea euphylliae]|uniref:ArsR family transcriptional regulator n=1 Tax=Thalassotalea euphylliae TaxID=1655234 RepID=A0A3E0TRR9_9GAMM|nr:metalloregulator ArsR/SmtB family transcription factor [Thalassotalea euphylliae]REL27208.1 ArsR family transcriptional regulator [Thalassotalea euphylliae]
MSPQQLQQQVSLASDYLKRLSHPTRLLVLCTLIESEKTVGELTQIADISQSALSQHLAVLREHQLVKTRRESQTIFYSLADENSIKIIDVLHQIFCPTNESAFHD